MSKFRQVISGIIYWVNFKYANYFVFAQVMNAGEHVINGKRMDPKKAIYIYFAGLGRKIVAACDLNGLHC